MLIPRWCLVIDVLPYVEDIQYNSDLQYAQYIDMEFLAGILLRMFTVLLIDDTHFYSTVHNRSRVHAAVSWVHTLQILIHCIHIIIIIIIIGLQAKMALRPFWLGDQNKFVCGAKVIET